MTNPIGLLTAADEGLWPPDRRHLRRRRNERPVVDREGVRHGRGPRRQPAARLRARQVQQPQRDGRVRGHVPGRRADHRAGEPLARYRPAHGGHRTDPLRGRRAAASGSGSCSSRTTRNRSRSTGSSKAPFPPRVRTPQPTAHRQPDLRRPRPVPPDRSLLGMGRDRRRADRDDARHLGLDARPLLGRPLRHRPTPPGRRATRDGIGNYHFFWTPSYLERPDGSAYGIFMVFNHFRRPGIGPPRDLGTRRAPGRHASSTIAEIVPELSYDPVEPAAARRSRPLHDGRRFATRTLEVEVVSDTGFHLGTGLYFGFDGHHHGEWRGELHVDGERIDDCSTPENARRVHQIRDTVVRITDPAGGGTGWGNWQPIVAGEHPDSASPPTRRSCERGSSLRRQHHSAGHHVFCRAATYSTSWNGADSIESSTVCCSLTR